MNPIIQIIDNFLVAPEQSRADLIDCKFADLVSPMDGVTYPSISARVPEVLVAEFVRGVDVLVGGRVHVRSLFSRAMFAGQSAPNKIHCDTLMGTYAAHCYMSDHWPDGAGTAFFTNKNVGMLSKPGVDESLIRPNERGDWRRTCSVQAAFNRLLIHRGDAWHLAEPIGGWGTNPANGRLVLTMFFDVSQ